MKRQKKITIELESTDSIEVCWMFYDVVDDNRIFCLIFSKKFPTNFSFISLTFFWLHSQTFLQLDSRIHEQGPTVEVKNVNNFIHFTSTRDKSQQRGKSGDSVAENESGEAESRIISLKRFTIDSQFTAAATQKAKKMWNWNQFNVGIFLPFSNWIFFLRIFDEENWIFFPFSVRGIQGSKHTRVRTWK